VRNARVLAMVVLLLAIAVGRAGAAAKKPPPAEPVVTVDWAQLRAAGKLAVGEFAAPPDSGGVGTIRLENPNDRPRTFTLVTLDKPPLAKSSWVLRGRVRGTAIEGKGYVEMLHRFPNGTVHFARTMDSLGPQAMLQGTEPWRDFAVAFRSFKSGKPSQIVIGVMLPKRGIVELGPLALYEGDAAVNAALGIKSK
jgi:hypothetical protein